MKKDKRQKNVKEGRGKEQQSQMQCRGEFLRAAEGEGRERPENVKERINKKRQETTTITKKRRKTKNKREITGRKKQTTEL